ncbi:AAA family ATPase [Streptacidiphilus pinicola]|nr:LuxR family transcriptional regulator [Streptacidiphilus pinicola]
MDGDNPAPRSMADELVGREQEVALLTSFVAEATRNGGLLLLSGDPGIGKSLLLDLAGKAATRAGALVLRSDGVEFQAGVSFSNLSCALAPLQGEIHALDPVRRDALMVALGIRSEAAVDHVVVYNAALALLRKAAGSRPLLIVVDDLQWVDHASAAAFAFISRRLAGSPVAFLAASRAGADTVFNRTGLPELELRPLDRAASARLVRDRFPGLSPRTMQCVLDQAKGNPLALLELPTAVNELRPGTLSTLSTVFPVSRRLQSLYAFRIQELPAPARRLLLLAALEGTGDLRILRAAGAGADALGDLAHAERAQLVRVDNGGLGRLTFRHPLVRATIVWGSTSDERVAAHTALAKALADRPDRQVWHLVEATADPDERIADLLEKSAHRARRRGDAVGALNALVRAADLSPGQTDRSRRLVEAASVGSDVAGELPTAAGLLVEARRANPRLRGSLQAAIAASNVLLNSDGDISTAFQLLLGAITADAGRTGHGDQKALEEALHAVVRVCLMGGRAELWDRLHAFLAQATVPVPRPLDLVGIYADPTRHDDHSLARLDVAIRDLHLESDPSRIVQIGRAAHGVDRTAQCRTALWRVVEDGRKGGSVASGIYALIQLCMDDFETGQWDECALLTDEGLRLSEAHGYRQMALSFQAAQALLAAVRGDEVTLRALTRQITAWTAPRGFRSVECWAHHGSALAALGRGDYETAYREASVISPPGVLPTYLPSALRAPMDLVEAAVRSGRRPEAQAHVAAIQQAGIAAVSPRLALLAAASAAIAAPKSQAAVLFEEALAIRGTDRWPFVVARVRLAYGQHLRHLRAAETARLHLNAAFDSFRHLGAVPWAARAAEELRASGYANSRAPGNLPANPLTAQEYRIATLAASGMTNKQIGTRLFLSHRSVAAHLHRLYPKLGITSRVTLAAALAEIPEANRAVK